MCKKERENIEVKKNPDTKKEQYGMKKEKIWYTPSPGEKAIQPAVRDIFIVLKDGKSVTNVKLQHNLCLAV